MYKIFIDGDQGTTGLDIKRRLSFREDIELLEITEDYRKDESVRLEIMEEADLIFLCLPDEESSKIARNISKKKKIIDTSTYHRTNENWVYGMPELELDRRKKIKESNRVTVPGCHANGFILLVKPLIEKGIIADDLLLSYNSVSGYSGGGKKMIEDYQKDKENKLNALSLYALSQEHKHIPEMLRFSGIKKKPIFLPYVANYYSGILGTLSLHRELTINPDKNKKLFLENLFDIYTNYYKNEDLISIKKGETDKSKDLLIANKYSGFDNLEIIVQGNDNRGVLISRYDNLGKGACGTAIQCMNIMLGIDESLGLTIKSKKD